MGRRMGKIPATGSAEFSAGSMPDFRVVRCPRSRAVHFRPTSLSLRACLSVGSTRPPLSVTRRDSSDCMLVVWSLRRPRACLSLRPLRTSTRRYASVSNSRDGHVHLLPPSFPIGLTSALGPTAGSVFDSLMSGLSAPILIPPYSTRTLGLLLPDPRPSPRTIFLFM